MSERKTKLSQGRLTVATVYEIITDRIVSAIEDGNVLPWRKMWRASGGLPRNLTTGKTYRGINVFLLAMLGYKNPFFLTFNQCKGLKGKITKGSKGCPVVFWKWPTLEDKQRAEAEGKIAYPLCRYYTVFNVSQCDGITHKRLTQWEDKQAEAETINTNETIEAAEAIVSNWKNGCAIEHEKTRAYYSPIEDIIGMPNLADFETPPGYYTTLFHEITHATGHYSRLNRFPKGELVVTFGSASYSKEELAAEMGASFLAAEAEIDPSLFLDNSTAYINGWVTRLKGDSKLVIYAASQAQKSTDSILNRAVNVTENSHKVDA